MRNQVRVGPIHSIYNQIHIKFYLHYAMDLVLILMTYGWNGWWKILLHMENKSSKISCMCLPWSLPNLICAHYLLVINLFLTHVIVMFSIFCDNERKFVFQTPKLHFDYFLLVWCQPLVYLACYHLFQGVSLPLA